MAEPDYTAGHGLAGTVDTFPRIMLQLIDVSYLHGMDSLLSPNFERLTPAGSA